MDAKKLLKDALSGIDPGAWGSVRTSHPEMLLAAAASLAAYAHPTEFELNETRRAIVVPSETFRRSVGRKEIFDSGSIPGSEGLIGFVETRYFVAATIKIRDFVLIAYRGTADAYDLFLDMKFSKIKLPSPRALNIKAHRGFAKAFAEGFPYVYDHLKSLEPYDHLIGTGHSLGGAICTLHNAVSNRYSNCLTNPFYWHHRNLHLHAMDYCVTFGCPKVGNLEFALNCPWGTNAYRSDDLVPNLPPSVMGFESQPMGRALQDPHVPSGLIDRWLRPLRTARSRFTFAGHSMEAYVDVCAKLAGVTIDP